MEVDAKGQQTKRVNAVEWPDYGPGERKKEMKAVIQPSNMEYTSSALPSQFTSLKGLFGNNDPI